ncbi:VPLPA-CTERM sorting domain-containing protein [Cognatiyoonia sp. IB215182]|uniref:VPLPA-CTERM sorting domain-containing protein n=1 Tax=Cognatiyoonia sp. IB215182 TaxID=3097353 RepID=UPI002A13E144|nr:VPLPA-CTERM sorting domain-containing protein [Cognatiyoonia sp. IB215182]MDX8351102.1 VPLPA-CTERM sorting domain-containing protein [Cognatiyoonia sp. IB215182]
MRKIFLATIAAGVLAAGGSAAATLTFDGYSHGDVITSVNLEGGVTAAVTANGNSSSSPDQAWIFDTSLSGTRDPDLEAPFTDDGVNFDINPGNALIIQENPNTAADDDGRGGWITFTFSRAITFLGFDFLDDGDVVVTDNNDNAATVGTPRGSAFDNYFTSSGLLNWTNVTQLTFNFGRDSGAIDNISYEIAPIPLPASLLLLLASIGALGFAARGRQTV